MRRWTDAPTEDEKNAMAGCLFLIFVGVFTIVAFAVFGFIEFVHKVAH